MSVSPNKEREKEETTRGTIAAVAFAAASLSPERTFTLFYREQEVHEHSSDQTTPRQGTQGGWGGKLSVERTERERVREERDRGERRGPHA